jgi:hypothetical protein
MFIDIRGVNLRNRRFPNQLLRFRMDVQIDSRLRLRRKYHQTDTPQSLLPGRRQKVVLCRSREQRIVLFLSARARVGRGGEPQGGRRNPQWGDLQFGLENRLALERLGGFKGIIPTGLKRIMDRLWRSRQRHNRDIFQLPILSQKRDGNQCTVRNKERGSEGERKE